MTSLSVEHYAGTPALGMEFRPYYLAREWVRAGHRVQMLAASYSHVRARQPAVGPKPLDETIDGIAYRWYPTRAYQGNGLGRVRNIAEFLWGVRRDAGRLVREFRPDVVIASSTYPMDIWVARHLARRAGAALVFEVHDLWPLSPIELSGMSPKHPFARLCAWAEADAYRDADVVVSMLPCVHDYMASRGLDLAKLSIVPNGIAPEDWAGTPAPLREDVAQALAEARAAGETVVGYAGSMGEPNALDTLLDAAALLRDDAAGRALRIVMVGDGHSRARLAQRVQSEQLTNVTMLAPIPKLQVPALLAGIDIAYIGWQRVPIYRFGIGPNKLLDYMMAGCAVLHSVEAGNDPVAEAGCGVTVAPQDARAVADGLLRLAAATPDERAAMGARGRGFVEARHTYPVLAQRFADAWEAPIPAAPKAFALGDGAQCAKGASGPASQARRKSSCRLPRTLRHPRIVRPLETRSCKPAPTIRLDDLDRLLVAVAPARRSPPLAVVAVLRDSRGTDVGRSAYPAPRRCTSRRCLGSADSASSRVSSAVASPDGDVGLPRLSRARSSCSVRVHAAGLPVRHLGGPHQGDFPPGGAWWRSPCRACSA